MAGVSPAPLSQASDRPSISPEGLSRTFPLLIAAAAALLAVASVGAGRFWEPAGTFDYDQLWHAARAVLAREDPYAVIGPGRAAGFPWPFYYPFTAAVVFAPLGLLPLYLARICFVVAGAAAVGYVIGRFRPVAWAFLFSTPFLNAALTMQLSPLFTVAMAVPAAGFLIAVKPNIGLVLLAQCRSRRQVLLALAGATALLLLSLALQPSWPLTWLQTVREADHFRPLITRPGGFLVLLALLRWRDHDARLILALGLVPQTGMWYEALPLFLTVRSRWEAALLAATSQIAFVATSVYVTRTDFTGQSWQVGTLVVWSLLLPALAFVLWRGRNGSGASGPTEDSPAPA